jgi:hypothetical protein
MSDDCSRAGSGFDELAEIVDGGTIDRAETMAARRANSRREIEELLLPFIEAPLKEWIPAEPGPKLSNQLPSVNFSRCHVAK